MAPTAAFSSILWPLAPIATISLYGLYKSYNNIVRLQEYEEKSEKAAEWSRTAANQLYKTRTTQASGTITLILSLLTPIPLLFIPGTSSILAPTLALVNTTTCLIARSHMDNFWGTKIEVPFVENFNKAIAGSRDVVVILTYLTFGWAATGILSGVYAADPAWKAQLSGMVTLGSQGLLGAVVMGMWFGSLV
ncbi:hypothetical protein P154DRAFT_620676 [Amniculicola lignicola CBS 123094]|uniref:DUF1772-domain-containing protein n=1 Tax=Amniculicola lignicola CBS 123094 TaxID=1392246 RepID=A0A6A5WDL0_9PLEO|nr:hypothetical protein P154DRAFT_620676 [Amniculicola lignicola CBS 123094]